MTTTEDKHRTITLTNHQPVQIRESEWPVIARNEWHDGEHAFQATRKQWLIIRQHADGRVLVYGGLDTAMRGEEDVRAGELLWPDAPIVAAIRRVAGLVCAEMTRPQHNLPNLALPNLAAGAIRDLPAIDVNLVDRPRAANG